MENNQNIQILEEVGVEEAHGRHSKGGRQLVRMSKVKSRGKIWNPEVKKETEQENKKVCDQFMG